MQKVFVGTNQIEETKIIIMGDDVKHIVNVLRMQIKEKIQVGNKETLQNYLTEIEEISKDKVILNIIEELQTKVEPNVKIDLYQGLPKADKMELIIQKTTEIGVSSIIPANMMRCIVKLDNKEENKKIERWQKVAKGAAEQSKRDIIPLVQNKINIKEIANKINEYDMFFVAYEDEKNNNLKKELQKLTKKENYKIGILIGPEGGIDYKEIEILQESGATIVSLGKRILRTETAPILMVSNILYELEV